MERSLDMPGVWSGGRFASTHELHIVFDRRHLDVQFSDMLKSSALNFDQLSRELVRSVRGKRPQRTVARALGYTGNPVYSWEAGTAWPTAARFFEMAHVAGVRSDGVLRRFFRDVPERLKGAPLTTPEGVRNLMVELLGTTEIGTLSKSCELSRFSLSRWLHGRGQPKLPELLRFVEFTSFRLLDFIASVTDPARVPSARSAWQSLQAARAVGYEHPLTHAVLRALEVTSLSPGLDDAEAIAKLLQIPPVRVQESLQLLNAAAQVRRTGDRWQPAPNRMVDFRFAPTAAQQLKHFWAKFSAERTRQRRPGLFTYTLFSVSRSDLQRVQELQRDYLRSMRTIIASSQPNEVVALINCQIFSLEDVAEEIA